MRRHKMIKLIVSVLTAVFLIVFFIPRPIIEKMSLKKWLSEI